MAKVLTETLIKLAGAGFTMAATGRCLLPLVNIVDQLGAPSLVKALKAGLLRAIISRHASESDSDDERVSRALKHLIRDILVDATFKYSFMVALKSVLPNALAIERTGGFMHSPRMRRSSGPGMFRRGMFQFRVRCNSSGEDDAPALRRVPGALLLFFAMSSPLLERTRTSKSMCGYPRGASWLQHRRAQQPVPSFRSPAQLPDAKTGALPAEAGTHPSHREH
ncbi:hypothetical protein B0H14DRAFT_80471 [Mycena olivaceomarginata]|nr:hypothetical protein B0H14DRAFT_80471 [Mycena olivaceomarginata]